jgi:hypothetical protein
VKNIVVPGGGTPLLLAEVRDECRMPNSPRPFGRGDWQHRSRHAAAGGAGRVGLRRGRVAGGGLSADGGTVTALECRA